MNKFFKNGETTGEENEKKNANQRPRMTSNDHESCRFHHIIFRFANIVRVRSTTRCAVVDEGLSRVPISFFAFFLLRYALFISLVKKPPLYFRGYYEWVPKHAGERD